MKNVFIFVCALAVSFQCWAMEKSCLKEVGKKKAEVLVDHCLQVSTATRPPCNNENSCSMMIEVIEYGCTNLKDDPKLYPKFCDSYLDKKK